MSTVKLNVSLNKYAHIHAEIKEILVWKWWNKPKLQFSSTRSRHSKSNTCSVQYHVGTEKGHYKLHEGSIYPNTTLQECLCTGAALIVSSHCTALISTRLLQRLTSCVDECKENMVYCENMAKKKVVVLYICKHCPLVVKSWNCSDSSE